MDLMLHDLPIKSWRALWKCVKYGLLRPRAVKSCGEIYSVLRQENLAIAAAIKKTDPKAKGRFKPRQQKHNAKNGKKETEQAEKDGKDAGKAGPPAAPGAENKKGKGKGKPVKKGTQAESQ